MTHVDKAEAWDALAEKNKEIQTLQQENRALKANPRACANITMVLSAVNANRKANELETDRDEWKRRALEAEGALRSLGPVLNAEAKDKIMEEAHSARLISEANPDDKYDRLFAGGLAILLELDRKVSAAICMNSINGGISATDIEAE